jgi:D-aminopeptidase
MRCRDAGIIVGSLPPGPKNAVTDVKNVRVGHSTLMEGDVNTGVTVVLPHEKDAENAHYFWGRYIHDSDIELTGIQVLEDFGAMSSPIFLTNLMAVGRVYNGGITFGYSRDKGLPTDGGWPPIVAGIDDRYLNNMRKRVITEKHALDAVANASGDNVEEGVVGAGTGAVAFGFKGGIGTSSRRTEVENHTYHIGVIVLANHGRRDELTILNIPVGEHMPAPAPVGDHFRSVIGIVATDAPLTPRQLNHLARRAWAGITRLGGMIDSGESGMVVSFSTGIELESTKEKIEHQQEFFSDSQIDLLHQAAAEAAEESVLNALFRAIPLKGPHGHVAQAIPIDTVIRILKRV